jgi:hypothetical protein
LYTGTVVGAIRELDVVGRVVDVIVGVATIVVYAINVLTIE